VLNCKVDSGYLFHWFQLNRHRLILILLPIETYESTRNLELVFGIF